MDSLLEGYIMDRPLCDYVMDRPLDEYIPKYLFEEDYYFENIKLISNRYKNLIIFIIENITFPYNLEIDESRCILQNEFIGPPYYYKDDMIKTACILQNGIILRLPNFKIRISTYDDLEYDIILMNLNNQFIDLFGYFKYYPKKIKYTALKKEILFLIKH